MEKKMPSRIKIYQNSAPALSLSHSHVTRINIVIHTYMYTNIHLHSCTNIIPHTCRFSKQNNVQYVYTNK